MSGKAEQSRDELVLQLMGVKSSLMQVCQTKPIVKRAVTRKIAELENVWGKLIKCHSAYCKAAGVGIESTESQEFIENQAKLKEEGMQLAETALGENEEEKDCRDQWSY